MKLPWLLITVLVSFVICVAQPEKRDTQIEQKLNRYVEAEMRRYKIPGVALAVLREGKLTILKSYGLANVELGFRSNRRRFFSRDRLGNSLQRQR